MPHFFSMLCKVFRDPMFATENQKKLKYSSNLGFIGGNWGNAAAVSLAND